MALSFTAVDSLHKFLLPAGLTVLFILLPSPVADPPLQITVERFGAMMPQCREWTDACSVCLRDGEGAVHCSTPGIACLPGVPVCMDLATP